MLTRTWPKVAIGLAVAAAIGVEVFVLSGAGDEPADAVTGYFQAAIDEDCPKAFDLLADPIRGSYGSVERLCDRARADTMVSFQVGDTELTDEGAKVFVTLVRPNLTLVDAVTLVSVEGAWKIASFEVVSSDRGHGQR
ncbi:hypothetical protein [Alloactinosynnema sp. L-07]|uniref:hypothetical protein n=1 Tax=Alloactinosynnema sp. L-07 TaxID=1653480 RepID=UPI00065EFCAE|nr:hypothetical protein [Alloactinosynnema sp. L-07]CRK62047.1 hypothetical protein [Alloactinosynnema sp. L-07]